MSKEQIEEMAKDLRKSEHWYFDEKSVDFELDRKKTAQTLYNAGYRKQSEGEWVFKQTYYEADECNCSVCGQLMVTAIDKRMNYCPNCGARMSGGKNE